VTRPVIGGLLLAGGLSARMDGPNKLLMPFHGMPVAAWSIRALAGSGLAPCVAVGHRDDQALQALPDAAALMWIHNPDAANGLSSSLKCGLAALREAGADAALVHLADMPHVGPALIRQIADAFRPEDFALIPTVGGTWGNPVVLSPDAIAAAQGLTGDRGARALLMGHDGVATLEVGDSAILRDLDTPADFLD
jgi:molybdenum cofactor cytidylyltransferase